MANMRTVIMSAVLAVVLLVGCGGSSSKCKKGCECGKTCIDCSKTCHKAAPLAVEADAAMVEQ